MPRRTVEDLIEAIGAILTGVEVGLVPDLYGSFERAVATFIQKADVPETMIRQPIMLYSGVTWYVPDPRMFGTAVIDVRPQAVNAWKGQVYKRPISDFKQLSHRLPYGYTVNFEYRDGDPLMGIVQGATQPQTNIDPMTALTGWNAADGTSDLALDNTVYYQSPASLRFSLDIGNTDGSLSKTLDNPLDLSSYLGVGVSFLAAYFPDATSIAGITLQLGSDAANYYQMEVTEGFLGAFYSNDFDQLIAFNLADATIVGNPDISAIQYVNILTSYPETFGPELVTNGSFAGDASGWTLNTNWAYGTNDIVHTSGSVATALQAIAATDPTATYRIHATIGGTAGSVTIGIGDPADFGGETFAAGAGDVTLDASGNAIADLIFSPTLTFNGTITNVSVMQITSPELQNIRYGGLFIALPTPHEVLFYSAAAFRPGSIGPFQVAVSTNEDEIVFRDASYNIYVQEAAREVAKNSGANIGSAMIAEIDQVLEGGGEKLGLYDQYRGDNPSEELRMVGNWYDDGYGYSTNGQTNN